MPREHPTIRLLIMEDISVYQPCVSQLNLCYVHPRACFKKGRIPDSQVPSTTLACLTTAPCAKTRPRIIVSIGGSDNGFRDTDRGRHPAGRALRF